ncbi:MAG TPA: RIP metalloprotease RseP [Candidatus Baltobacteraceae bacterium]|jgi:regulator of sigma E protease|nr:RIP metalloprotease RseP [Candidatus Baltobacteraceae bacterium]
MSQIFKDLYIAGGVVFLFGAAIFVHEFGHYWVARKRGLKVEAFAIGFGPKIFSWVRDGIEYSVRCIPAGGFVKLPQMITSSAIEGDAKKEEIPPAAPLSKILVAAAGPFMNVVFAFFIAAIIYLVGLPVPVNPSIIGYVDPDSAEAKMGIQQGDRIVAVNGKPVKSWEEINNITILALTNTLPVVVTRNGVSNTYMLKTEVNNLVGLKTLALDPLDYLIIKAVAAGGPAEAAHLKMDDEVVGFAGVPVSSRQQLISLIQKRGDAATPIVVKRDNKRLTLVVTPVTDSTTKKSRIGVEFSLGKDVYEIDHPTPWAQVRDVCEQVYGTVSALVHSHESGVKASDLSGPVGIIGGLAIQWSTDYRLALSFLVMLNINLAILNMLPMPVLDGGHILMAIIERIRRRPLEVRIVEYTTTAFAVLLISFMAYVTMYDIKRLPLFHLMFNRETQIEQTESPASPAPDSGSKQDRLEIQPTKPASPAPATPSAP